MKKYCTKFLNVCNGCAEIEDKEKCKHYTTLDQFIEYCVSNGIDYNKILENIELESDNDKDKSVNVEYIISELSSTLFQLNTTKYLEKIYHHIRAYLSRILIQSRDEYHIVSVKDIKDIKFYKKQSEVDDNLYYVMIDIGNNVINTTMTNNELFKFLDNLPSPYMFEEDDLKEILELKER